MMYITHVEGIEVQEQDVCRVCLKKLERGHRVRSIFVAVGVHLDPKGAGRALVLYGFPTEHGPIVFNEFIHYDCADPTLSDVGLIVYPDKRTMINNFAELEPRGPDYQCVKCRREYQRGDRIATVHMVLGVGMDPTDNRKAAMVGGSFETAHVDCQNKNLHAKETIILSDKT